MADAEPNSGETEFPDNIAWWLELPPDGFIDCIVGTIRHDLNSIGLSLQLVVDQPLLAEALETPVTENLSLRDMVLNVRSQGDHINEILKLTSAFKRQLREENKSSGSSEAE